MKKLIATTVATALLSGCSVARMADQMSGDMSYAEYSFIRVLQYSVDNMNHCSKEYQPIKTMAYKRIHQADDYINPAFDPVSALASLSDTDDDCIIYAERIVEWSQTGELPAALGGSTTDPKWTKPLTDK